MSLIDHAKAALHFECEELNSKNAELLSANEQLKYKNGLLMGALFGSFIRVTSSNDEGNVSKTSVGKMLIEYMERCDLIVPDEMRLAVGLVPLAISNRLSNRSA